MANAATTELRVKVGVTGDRNLTRLSRSLQNLGRDTVKANFNFKRFSAVLQEKERRAVKSINTTRQFSAAWKELANSVRIGSDEFKKATAQAARLDAQLKKAQPRGGRWIGAAKTAGAVAGSAVFGGPEGAIGAAIGGLIPGAGPAGALVGGAIGAQVGMIRQSIGATAEYSAKLNLQRKALRLVIGDTEKYTKAQAFLEDRSRKLAIPQDLIVRQFTSLTASVTGAGRSVEDAEEVFKSIAAGIRGTGGSLEDMRAAMVATSQVFSKGKVSAEELRQQLGERLPGAFTIFAESMGKTPAELDKALEQGLVTLEDFMTFSKTLFEKYGDNAEILAKSPEAAGDRLATSMSFLKDEIGKLLTPMGADFQTFSAEVVDSITDITKALNRLFGIGDENKLKNLELQLKFWKKLQQTTNNISESLKRLPGGDMWGLEGTAGFEGTKATVENLEAQIKALKVSIEKTNDLKKSTSDVSGELKKQGSLVGSLQGGWKDYANTIESVFVEIQGAVKNTFMRLEDQLVNFVTKGKFEFRKFAQAIIADITRIIIRQTLLNTISGFKFGSIFGRGGGGGNSIDKSTGANDLAGTTSAMAKDGKVFASNGIQKFGRGGLVTDPTYFRFAQGIGVLGEAGSEAIMPLRRGPSGRLGVEAIGGGGATVVNIAVDATGSSVEGQEMESRQLGQVFALAIQTEIVRQKRPGGLLA